MIPAKDLRIGNKFMMAGGKMVQTVFDIKDNTDRGRMYTESESYRAKYSHLITCIENGNQYHPFEIDGVPITEEWLLKLGFNSIDSDPDILYYTKNNVALNAFGDHSKIWLRYVSNTIEIKSVHQLQNLYFALTGEELTIKP
jgi:hypothetical protein